MLHGWQYLDDETRARIEAGIVENRVLGGPWHVTLHPTNTCNVGCFFCSSYAPYRNEVLPWPALERFLRDNARSDLRMVNLTGGGEPLVYSQIHSLIETCGELGLFFEHVGTNGILLAPLARRFVDVGLGRVTVSLNETNPQRYSEMMDATGGDFHQAVEGIEATIEARDSVPPDRRPRIWLQLILWKGNASHICEMYEFARRFSVDTIFLRTVFGQWKQPKLGAEDLPSVKSQLREIIREDCRSGENRLHFDLAHEQQLHHFSYAEQRKNNPPVSENFPEFCPANPRTEYCFVGWSAAGIDATGTVYPCFDYHEYDNKGMGSILTGAMDDIWRGKAFGEFRYQIHELMRLEGRMEASRRYYRFLEPKCIDLHGCQYTHRLATPEFYRRVARGVRERTKIADRLRARASNCAIRCAHLFLNGARKLCRT